jgi:hypothetical protein
VHRSLLENGGAADDPALLAAGLEQVLSAPDPVLRGYAEELRVRMLELALRPEVPTSLADRAAGVLLSSLPHDGKIYARLALRRAAHLLARHADDRARVVLEDLHRAQPGVHAAERWLGALGARRLGRVALEGGLPERGRLARALWLDGQRPVWVRTAASPEAERLAAEARLQAGLALPGVAPVVEHGVASGIPYIAVSGPGRPLVLDAGGLNLAAALSLATAAARTLRALGLTGVAVPDAAPERFLYNAPATLVLADLDGLIGADPMSADRAHATLAAGLTRRLLPGQATARLAPDVAAALERTLDEPADLVTLVGCLDQAALRAGRD